MLKDQKGQQPAIAVKLNAADFYYNPVWSPDSKKIVFSNKHLQLFYIDINEKKAVKIDEDTYDRPDASFDASWSPDSKWILYNKKLKNNLRAIQVYDLTAGKSTQLTDGRSEAGNPAFSRDGKYIFFTASTNYGRAVGWLDMSSYEVNPTNNIYAIVLSKNASSLLVPESDEETVKPDTVAKAPSADPKAVAEKSKPEPAIDWAAVWWSTPTFPDVCPMERRSKRRLSTAEKPCAIVLKFSRSPGAGCRNRVLKPPSGVSVCRALSIRN